MSEAPPDEYRDDTQAYLEYLDEQGASDVADYLGILYDDYYDGNLTGSDRYFTIDTYEGVEVDMDIAWLIDIAVMFGWVWEREDPYDPEGGE